MGIQISNLHKELVQRYGRAIAHMRQLVEKRRLGLVLGAGIGQAAGLPSWVELIKGISKRLSELSVEGRDLAEESSPVQAQILLSRFRQYLERKADFSEIEASHRDATVAVQWRKLLRDVIYHGIENPADLLIRHGYMEDLAILAYKIPIVVTYNFDDLLEQALAKSEHKPKDTVGYYSAWGSNFVVQDGRPVVYHPNGYLPFYTIDRYSEQVILTEEAISDQVIDSLMGSFALLLDYYSRTSCLFLGFSLSDPALRSMLRQASRRSPGTVHYYVRYCPDGEPPPLEQSETTETNFELFNMVTLYLSANEIKALLQLVAQIERSEFDDVFVNAGVETTYRHYVTGPVAVGKTTVLSRLQGVEIVDEWLKPRDPLIAKPHNQLLPEELEKVDNWILEQLRLKNGRFEGAHLGLHLMDRAPLDALAFTPEHEHREKAMKIFNVACAGASGKPHDFCPGKLIFLKGRPYDLLTRQKWRGRDGDEDYISQQQTALLEVYNTQDPSLTSIVETSGLSVEMVVKKVLRIIHLEPYQEFNFTTRLKHYLQGV
jgi:deoxyadenosine/deoxycytidine kinase